MEQEFEKLKTELDRLSGITPGARAIPPTRLKALRIRARTFLDANRRALPRHLAADLRGCIERLDRAISDVSARQRV
jgi:hypothetical protein